jgi:hypothetical protein
LRLKAYDMAKVKYVVAPIIAPTLEISVEQYEVYLRNYWRYRDAVLEIKTDVKVALVARAKKQEAAKEKREPPAPLSEEQIQARRQRRTKKKSERRKLRKQQKAISDAERQVKVLQLEAKAASLQKEVRKAGGQKKSPPSLNPSSRTVRKEGRYATANRKARRQQWTEIAAELEEETSQDAELPAVAALAAERSEMDVGEEDAPQRANELPAADDPVVTSGPAPPEKGKGVAPRPRPKGPRAGPLPNRRATTTSAIRPIEEIEERVAARRARTIDNALKKAFGRK